MICAGAATCVPTVRDALVVSKLFGCEFWWWCAQRGTSNLLPASHPIYIHMNASELMCRDVEGFRAEKGAVVEIQGMPGRLLSSCGTRVGRGPNHCSVNLVMRTVCVV